MRAGLPPDYRPSTPSRRLFVASADRTRLAVEIYGESPDDAEPAGTAGAARPTVVLAHGWTCSASFWVRVVNRLRTEARVVVYDQRGHGRSQPVCAGGFTPAALADDLAAVLTATVPADRPAVVAGHSMGAMALVALAGRHPDVLHERVRAALLASTGVAELVGRFAVRRAKETRLLLPEPRPAHLAHPAHPARPGRPARAARPARTARPLSAKALAAREHLMRAGTTDPRLLHALPLPVARSVITEITMSSLADRAEREYVTDIVLACPPATLSGFARMLAALDLRADLASLDVPTLVLVGTRDRLTPPWHARGLAAALPQPLGLVELAGHGHMTPVTAPDAVADAVRRLVGAARGPALSP